MISYTSNYVDIIYKSRKWEDNKKYDELIIIILQRKILLKLKSYAGEKI